MFRVILASVLGFYIGTNFYISHMLARWLGLRGAGAVVWYGVFALVAGSYFLTFGSGLPAWLNKSAYLVGGIYMAVYLLLVLLVPLFHLVLRSKNGPMTAGLLLILAVLYGAAGVWNAVHIRTTSYTVDGHGAAPMKVALISDLHVGELIGPRQVEKMVEAINAIDADIVLMAGDLFDVAGPQAVRNLEEIGEILKGIRSKQGIYAVFGNHDGGLNGQHSYAAQLMESWGMTLLQDEAAILDGVTIIGRKDRGKDRLSIAELMEKADAESYTIMMDHQPFELEIGRDNGVDLMVCGHTHGGQVFPANLVTQRMYTIDHGIWQSGDFTAIVSSGAGTWGPRMRIGTISEVVEIIIK